MSDKIMIEFKGKQVEVTPIQPGLVQKSPTIFYIQDCMSKKWGFAFPARVERLRETLNNDFATYRDRATKRADKIIAKAAKKSANDAPVAAPEAVPEN